MKMRRLRDNRSKEGLVSGPRVLVIMDEPERLILQICLPESLGCEVLACESYAEGLAILQHESFDFVAVGQGGKAFEGREVVARVMEQDRSTPVLVLARTSYMKNYLEAMQLGAVDYLEMPVPTEEFTRVLRTHLRCRPAA